ncbi:methylmalonyl-CoA mutase C-terminal domain protein [Archaeoglobus sulfaticallidus PM70-1]|uniref:Methylmalonyl-CoA mutase C-terminal domain protein n=1 Tax=Archaeoglobus sulfaticallidus PM70-1 TaxID=387631 RepID=N0BF90_9EURY|nr:cobalamin B12-binding domain-containing protein [Archaeoglobus sulfaticallidus]AGK61688.1 methylmalonyl-CoA mutase C-terminal domain protein [Archaeoglobus sulfaticallidus PM70-1]
MEKKIRVLVAKVGLDGHDRGAKVVARFLRDAGFEVIYSGLHRTPEEVAMAAVQEDVDVIGISLHSGAHMTLVPKVLNYIKEYGGDPSEMVVLVGGIIPEDEFDDLKALGVDGVFIPGTPMSEIINFINEKVKEKKGIKG